MHSSVPKEMQVADVLLRTHSADVTSFGQTRQVSAVSPDALEDEVLALLLSDAARAGGQIHVRIGGTESRQFVLSAQGSVEEVPQKVSNTFQPDATEGERSAPSLPIQIPPAQVLRAGSPAASLDTFALEPATWGFAGWLNRVFRLRFKPSRSEVAYRRQQDAKTRAEADNRVRLSRELKRTNGYCGYIAVVSEKGGVGKTTTSALLAYFIAQLRQQSVLVADLNPDRGSLPARLGVQPQHSIRDLVRAADEVLTFQTHAHEFLAKMPRANVHVLAGDTDAARRDLTAESDVEVVARVCKPFFQVGILDNGTGISHSAMTGSLAVSQGAVIVVDNTVGIRDFVRSALAHLESHGHAELRERVVLVVNEQRVPPPPPRVDVRDKTASAQMLATHQAAMAKYITGEQLLNEPDPQNPAEAPMRQWVRDAVVIPYDAELAAGDEITFQRLAEPTKRAAEHLAAILMDDLV